MQNRIAVIGLGRFGTSVARRLAEKGAEVIAIDISEDKVEGIKDDVAHAISMDATDIKTLKSQHIHEVDAAVVSIGRNFESSVLCTVNLFELNIKRVIARAMTDTQKIILEKIGVKDVVSPEIEKGITLADKLLNPGILTYLPLPDEYEIVEVTTPTKIQDRSIEELNLRKRYNLNLITIMRGTKEIKKSNGAESIKQHILGIPGPETILQEHDVLVLMGKEKDVKRFIDINQ